MISRMEDLDDAKEHFEASDTQYEQPKKSRKNATAPIEKRFYAVIERM